MDEYYAKYAKPLDDISITEAKVRLGEWQNFTREELELLIFILNGIKSESLNRLKESSKSKLISVLIKLKSSSISIMNNISDFFCEIESRNLKEVDINTYSKIEQIRNEYNKQLQNNHKTFSGRDILVELKDKFYNMQKMLNETKEDLKNPKYYSNHMIHNSNLYINRTAITSKIPKLNLNIPSSQSNNKISIKSNRNVYKKMCLEQCRNNFVNDSKCMIDNETKDNEFNELKIKQRPSSQRDNLPPKHPKGQSLLNISDIPPNQLTTCPDQLSQIIQIKTELLIIQEEMKALKTKKTFKIPINGQVDEELVSQLTNQNLKIRSEMSNMSKDMKELFNTIKMLKQKITKVLDDNNSIKQENESLKHYIYQSNHSKNQLNSTKTNTANLNSRNNNSNNDLYHHQQSKSITKANMNYNNNHNGKIHSHPLNCPYESNSHTLIPELQTKYIENENKETQ